MEIKIGENKQIVLLWEYKILKKSKVVDEVEYSYYSATFPQSLYHFLDTREVWLREDEGQVYLLPVEEGDAKKIRISDSGRDSLSFSLPKKIFSHIDERDFVRIVFDGVSIILSLF